MPVFWNHLKQAKSRIYHAMFSLLSVTMGDYLSMFISQKCKHRLIITDGRVSTDSNQILNKNEENT